MTNDQWWRELKIALALRMLRFAFGWSARVQNEIGCTVALVLAEDYETYLARFRIEPRFHVTANDETVQ